MDLAASIPELVHISKDSDDPELDDITETNMITIKNVTQTFEAQSCIETPDRRVRGADSWPPRR